uniref:Extracellular superoxide dismutase [Cu-Zn] n=2 Tax=Clastoptera arizonana TaxID=38151 RepID=A0A1B6D9K4_9HEMI
MKMSSVKIEFAVQMTCHKCVEDISSVLSNVSGLEKFDISLEKESVIVQTSLPSDVIKEKIESTGRRVVLKGYGYESVQSSAVAMLGGNTGYSWGEAKGVVRLVQLDNDNCIVDGTIDGLKPGAHGLHIYECGDLSNGCDKLGNHFSLMDTRHGGPQDDQNNRHTGDLGNVIADDLGRASFRFVDKVVKVWDVIGRSLVVTEDPDDLGKGKTERSTQDGNSGRRIACGIISRSAGLNQNPKQICACDGVSIWDERTT